ncbi:hypothetical protein KC360_g154 [Hortaea werneckii]|nr:hypothetical protein KC360_g154 [Hortaea werneckii]
MQYPLRSSKSTIDVGTPSNDPRNSSECRRYTVMALAVSSIPDGKMVDEKTTHSDHPRDCTPDQACAFPSRRTAVDFDGREVASSLKGGRDTHTLGFYAAETRHNLHHKAQSSLSMTTLLVLTFENQSEIICLRLIRSRKTEAALQTILQRHPGDVIWNNVSTKSGPEQHIVRRMPTTNAASRSPKAGGSIAANVGDKLRGLDREYCCQLTRMSSCSVLVTHIESKVSVFDGVVPYSTSPYRDGVSFLAILRRPATQRLGYLHNISMLGRLQMSLECLAVLIPHNEQQLLQCFGSAEDCISENLRFSLGDPINKGSVKSQISSDLPISRRKYPKRDIITYRKMPIRSSNDSFAVIRVTLTNTPSFSPHALKPRARNPPAGYHATSSSGLAYKFSCLTIS